MKCLIFTSFILIFSFQEFLSMKLYGDYYIENEGYIPAALTAEPVSYEVGLTRSQYNKLVVGKYNFSRKVGPIGLYIALKRQSDGTRINEVKIKNVCKMEYPLDPFREKFSGILDEDCCIKAGNYSLTNWTLEEHMRPRIKSFWYGKFIANLRFTEVNETFLEQDLVLVFKDRDLKKFEEKHVKDLQPKEGSKKRKKNKSKGRSDGENPNLSEIGEKMNPKVPGEMIPKAGENMKPKVPNPANINPKVKENAKPKVPNPGGMGEVIPSVLDGKDAITEFGGSEVPTIGTDMSQTAPRVRENKKRRPKRVSQKN